MSDPKKSGVEIRIEEHREVYHRTVEVRMEGYPPEAIERIELASPQPEPVPNAQRALPAIEGEVSSPVRGPEASVAQLPEAAWRDRQARNPNAQYLPRTPTTNVSFVTASPQDHQQRIEQFGATPLDQYRGVAKNQFTAAMQGNTESVAVQEARQLQPLPKVERTPVHPVLDAKGEQLQGDFAKAASGEKGEGRSEGGGLQSSQVANHAPEHNNQAPSHVRGPVDRVVHGIAKSEDHRQTTREPREPRLGTVSPEEVDRRIAEKAMEKEEVEGKNMSPMQRLITDRHLQRQRGEREHGIPSGPIAENAIEGEVASLSKAAKSVEIDSKDPAADKQEAKAKAEAILGRLPELKRAAEKRLERQEAQQQRGAGKQAGPSPSMGMGGD